MLKVGDIVREGKRIGTITRIASKGTADVLFRDNPDYAIRRQEENLVVVEPHKRNNPMSLKRVPSKPKSTGKCGDILVYDPKRGDKSFEIGDLHCAIKSLEEVSELQTVKSKDAEKIRRDLNVDVRDMVICAVQQVYPEYDWASWWNRKAARKPFLATWDEYVGNYRIVDGEKIPLGANPFCKVGEQAEDIDRRDNPRYQVAEFDPDEAQFQAEVQGIYESLVKKELGFRSSERFKNRSGVRLDQQAIISGRLSEDDLRQLLSNAFAIATRQGQKHGRLQPGTQKATAKGRKQSRARLQDLDHLAENIQDYETTLGLVRKGESYRIVKRRGRFYIQPHEDAFNSAGYKSESGAKGVLTRYLNQLRDPSNLPTLDNPRPRQGSAPISDADARWLRREERRSKYRKPPKSKGYIADYGRKLSWAEGRGMVQRWKSEGKTPDEIAELVSKQRLSGKQAPGMDDLTQQPIEATVIIQYAYLPEMMSKGQPYLIYRRAPIAAFYTIELFGPRYKFQISSQGQKTTLLDRKDWRSASWAGMDGFNIKEDVEYDSIRGGVKTGVRFKTLPYITCAFYPGSRLKRANGFRPDIVGKATRNVIDAYAKWYKEHEAELRQSNPELVYPDDCLEPIYDIDRCRGNDISVINPILHFGVFLRALVSLLEFKDALMVRGKGYYLNMQPVLKWIDNQGLRDVIIQALESENIQLDGSLLATESSDKSTSQKLTKKEEETLQEIDAFVQATWQPFIDHIKSLDITPDTFGDTKNAAVSEIEKIVRKQQESARTNWLSGAANIQKTIRTRYARSLENYAQKMQAGGLGQIPVFDLPDREITQRPKSRLQEERFKSKQRKKSKKRK